MITKAKFQSDRFKQFPEFTVTFQGEKIMFLVDSSTNLVIKSSMFLNLPKMSEQLV